MKMNGDTEIHSLHFLRNDFRQRGCTDVGKSEIATRIATGEPSLIETDPIQDDGVENMEVDMVVDRSDSVFTGCAKVYCVRDAPAGAGQGKPRWL